MDDQAPKRNWRWPVPRVARAAYLYGLGKTVEEIAADIFIQASPIGVTRALKRAGVYVGTQAPAGVQSFHLDKRRSAAWEAAAARRATTMPVLLRKVAEILADDLTLLDNILDDGG
jgi:hypothetical protein